MHILLNTIIVYLFLQSQLKGKPGITNQYDQDSRGLEKRFVDGKIGKYYDISHKSVTSGYISRLFY